MGNHEYYGKTYPKHLNKLRLKSKYSNVKILDNNSFCFQDTIFLGCTLWTNFELNGDYKRSSIYAENSMIDFRKIRISPKYSKVRARDLAILNRKSVKWLEDQISNNTNKKIIVVTHHAPSRKSIPEKYTDDSLSPAFASDLESLIESSNIKIWIHGHVHESFNYQISSTTILCNPRGYPGEMNPHFNPEMVVEI